MAEKQQLPKTVKFTYKESDGYRVVYANGAYGNVNAKSELVFDFFREYNPLPGEQNQPLIDGLPIEAEGEVPEQVEVIRERVVGIVLTLENAESIANWMLRRIEEFRENLEKVKERFQTSSEDDRG